MSVATLLLDSVFIVNVKVNDKTYYVKSVSRTPSRESNGYSIVTADNSDVIEAL